MESNARLQEKVGRLQELGDQLGTGSPPGQSGELSQAASDLLSDLAVQLRDASLREPLAATELPNLLRAFIGHSSGNVELAMQTARVAANLVIDNDNNRLLVHKSGYLSAITGLLKEEAIPSFLSRHTGDLILRCTQAAVVSILNLIMGEDKNIKLDVIRPEIIDVLLELANAIYLPLEAPSTPSDSEEWENSLQMRATIVGWLWKILGESLVVEGASEFVTSALVVQMMPPIRSFDTRRGAPGSALLTSDAIEVDLQILSTACAALEVLSTCKKDVLAGFTTVSAEDGSMEPLEFLLDFVETAELPSAWDGVEDDDNDDDNDDEDDEAETSVAEGRSTSAQQRQITFGKAKASLLRGVIEVAAELEPSEDRHAGFWDRLKRWMALSMKQANHRADLVGCALLCYGNYARSDEAVRNLSLDKDFRDSLHRLLDNAGSLEDHALKHGLVGLLKNLCLPGYLKTELGLPVMKAMLDMEVWSSKNAMMGTVQGGSVVIMRHLCRENLENALAITVQPYPAATEELLNLFDRTDDQAIKIEIARTFATAIKTLSSLGSTGYNQQSVAAAKTALSSPRIVKKLLQLIVLGEKYPVVIGEAVLALALLAEEPPRAHTIASILSESNDDLEALLRDFNTERPVEAPPVPEEIKSNICVLLLKLRGEASVEANSKLKSPIHTSLDRFLSEHADSDSIKAVTRTAATQALQAWQ